MPHTCQTCGNIFLRKSQSDAHMARKTPCKKPVAVQVLEQKIKQLEGKGPFRENSVKFHESLTKETRQEQGIFFTPKKARDLLFEKLRDFGVAPRVILEPSFGSGEFLADMRGLYPAATIHAVEKNNIYLGKIAEFSLKCFYLEGNRVKSFFRIYAEFNREFKRELRDQNWRLR